MNSLSRQFSLLGLLLASLSANAETRIVRMWDEANRTLVYVAISRKLIEGAPASSISTIPVMPWGSR